MAGAGSAESGWHLQPITKLVPLNEANAARELAEIAAAAKDENCLRLTKLLGGKGPAAGFLAAVFDLSPFLRDLARRRPQMLEALFDRPVEARLGDILSAIGKAASAEDVSESSLMTELRTCKAEAHFLIALADLAGEADTALTVRRLSDLADACIRSATDFLLRDAHRQGKLKLADVDNPSKESGWILLGMGKLGAHELNFSSDI